MSGTVSMVRKRSVPSRPCSPSDFHSLARLLAIVDGCPVGAAAAAQSLLSALGSLSSVLSASKPKLRMLGADDRHVEALHASHQLAQNALRQILEDRALIPNRSAAVNLLRKMIAGHDREHLAALYLSGQLELLHSEIVSVGSVAKVELDRRAIVTTALLVNARSIIIAHNHPSGSLEPSPEDMRATVDLRDLCRSMDINLLDHLVVGSSDSSSLADFIRLP